MVQPSTEAGSVRSPSHRLDTRWALIIGLVVAGLMLAVTVTPVAAMMAAPPPDRGEWVTIARLETPRSGHTATLLADGSVLVAGGVRGSKPVLSLELVYPDRAVARAAGVLPFGLSDHDAVALPDGRVLLAGGNHGTMDADPKSHLCAPLPPLVWDPTTLSVEPVAGIPDAGGSSATLLEDGRVLLAGGRSECTWKPRAGGLELKGRTGFPESVVWDPVDGTVEPTGSLAEGRTNHFALRLADGNVLVAGGERMSFQADLFGHFGNDTAEVWDRATGSWSTLGSIELELSDVALVPDGRVVLASWFDGPALSILDPASGDVSPVKGGPPARRLASLQVLGDGRVMLVGGVAMGGAKTRDRPVQHASVWDPTTNAWMTLKYPKAGADEGQATVLAADGTVLVIGGRDLHDRKARAIGSVEALRR